MSYYHLPTDTARNPGRLETKLSDGALLGPPPTGWTEVLAALCGFVKIIDTVRPPDTATSFFERSLDRVGDVVTVVWTEQAKTAEQIDAEAARAADEVERQAARDAITNLDAYLALTAPTNAQVKSAVDYLAKVAKRLIVDQYGSG